MLDERKMRILRAIVTDYVSSREPVGSKALVERYQLNVSPATVRNDMAVLEEEGYLTQPHTSAGRIPTDKGYRLFVDRLGVVKPLSSAEKRAIESFMAGAVDIDDVVRRTVTLLARVTQQVALVQYPNVSKAVVRHVELVTLSPERVLLIVVTSSGRVEQKTLTFPPLDDDDFITVREKIAEAIVGHQPRLAAQNLATLVDELPATLSAAGPIAISAALELLSAETTDRLVIGGVPNLSRFGVEFESAIRPVLEALEEQVVLLQLLGETAVDRVSVRIGRENPYEPLQATSMVAASYGQGDDIWANLGIVGPTRMDYPSTIATVRAVARYVGRVLAEG